MKQLTLTLLALISLAACDIDIKSVTKSVVPVFGSDLSGTAFFISPTKLVSAAHVCGTEPVMLDAVSKAIYVVVKTDTYRDICLLTTIGEHKSKNYLDLAHKGLEAGDEGFIIGYPLLIGQTVVRGYHLVPLQPNEFESISAPIQKGNSGGPIVNKKAQVLGVVISYWRGTEISNYTKLEHLKEFLNVSKDAN